VDAEYKSDDFEVCSSIADAALLADWALSMGFSLIKVSGLTALKKTFFEHAVLLLHRLQL
jgi:hypothetical protein